MFVNKIDAKFFLKTRDVLKHICKGSPTCCSTPEILRENFSFAPLALDEEGTQSFVGILGYKKDSNLKLVFKFSRDCDNVVAHEYDVLRQVDKISKTVPHFARVYGLVDLLGPLDIEDAREMYTSEKREVSRGVLLTEFIHNWGTMYDFMETCSQAEALSLITQVLFSIRALKKARIAHNDLHCGNILVRKCNPEFVLKYIFGDTSELVPTRGVIATIIDFGHGRCEPSDKSALLGSLEFSHYGLNCDIFSPTIDHTRFFSAVRSDCKYRFPKLYNWCNTLLDKIPKIQKESGWDSFCKKAGAVEVAERVYKEFKGGAYATNLFRTITWIHSLQLLIVRPVQNMGSSADVSVFEPFLSHWKKFEQGISSLAELNEVFRLLVLAVKMWREELLGAEPNVGAKIEQTFLEGYSRLIKFHCPKVDYEEMAVSLLAGASFVETSYYKHFQKLERLKPARSGPVFEDNSDDIIWASFKLKFKHKLACADSGSSPPPLEVYI